jgi:hypothetical protein
METNTFTSNAKGLAKNPLGIIALFLSLIYVLACLVLGSTISLLVSDERKILIWFIVLFPVCILIVFFILVTYHHTKLYAPSDFKDEKNFIESSKQTKYVNQRENKIIEKIENNSENKHILSLLTHSSVTGLLALYAVKLSIEKNIGFSLENLESNVEILEKSYTHGYLVACSSVGVFSFVSNETIFVLTELSPLVSNNIKQIVDSFAEIELKENKSNYLKEQIDLLEKAFNDKK